MKPIVTSTDGVTTPGNGDDDQKYPADSEALDITALCLSGGGYRAMLFHTGALWRLHETRVLMRIALFSSVSGGSIANAWLARNWSLLNAPGADFARVYVEGIRRLARKTIDVPAILRGMFLGSAADRIARALDRALLKSATLQDLPDHPLFIFDATNLQSGALWRFCKFYMGDYKVGRVFSPDLPLADAVAASSAFPPFLSPLTLTLAPDRYVPKEPSPAMRDADYRTRIMLTDGGVYDNLGLEPVIKRARTVLASDGGMPFRTEPRPWRLWPLQMLRVRDSEDNQVRGLRKRYLIAQFQMDADLRAANIKPSTAPSFRSLARKGTYWGITTDVANYPEPHGLPCPPELTAPLARLPTRLARMSEENQERLINWGYAVCDYAIRAHLDPSLPRAKAFPYPRGLN